MASVCGEISKLFTPEAKLISWLDVETAACYGLYRAGEMTRKEWEQLERGLHLVNMTILLYRSLEIEKTTKHEMTAFLAALQEQLNGYPNGYVHYGLTSSDIMDTASHGTYAQALILLISASPSVWHTDLLRRATEGISCGKLSGPMGTGATYPPIAEEYALRRLGLAVSPINTQIIPCDRLTYMASILALLCSWLARKLGGLWMLEASLVRGHLVALMESLCTWHERDLTNSSVERICIPAMFTTTAKMLHEHNQQTIQSR